MEPERRDFLKVTATAALAGLAGCSETTDNSNSVSTPEYANWMYNPDEVLGFGGAVFATADAKTLLELPGALPDDLRSTLNSYQTLAVEIPLDDITRMTLMGGLGGENGQTAGTLALEGAIDKSDLEAEIEEAYQHGELETDSRDGYSLYSLPASVSKYNLNGWYFGQEDSKHTASLGFAVGADEALASVVTHESTMALDTIHAMLDANDDSTDSGHYHTASEAGQRLLSTFGDDTVAVGGEFFATALEERMRDADESTDAVENLSAMGVGTTIEDDTATATVAFTFASENAATKANTKALLEFILENTTPNTDNLAVGERTVTLSTETTVDTLQENYATLLWHQSTDDQQNRALAQSAPTVQFEYDRTSDGKYTIMHSGGDGFEASNVAVRYTDTNGEQQETQWKTPETVSAGDSVTTDTAVQPDSTIRVLWRSPDGGNSSSIGVYETPE